MVFYGPTTALDLVYTVGRQVAESVQHRGGTRAAACALWVLELVRVRGAAQRLDASPYEVSGGLRRRAIIAIALTSCPRLRRAKGRGFTF